MQKFKLPRPWRLLLTHAREVESDSKAYRYLLEAFLTRHEHDLSLHGLYSSSIDMQTGKFRFELNNGCSGHADPACIGWHNGRYFFWADLYDGFWKQDTASLVRKALQPFLGTIVEKDRLQIGIRDVRAVMALAARQLEFKNTVLVTVGNASYAECLLEQQEIHKLELKLNQISRQYRLGDYVSALVAIESLKDELGQCFFAQEPASWIMACEGACLLELNSIESAHQAFRGALRAASGPDENHNYPAMAQSNPVGFYVSNMMRLCN